MMVSLNDFKNIALIKINYRCNQDCIFCHEDLINLYDFIELRIIENYWDAFDDYKIDTVLLSGGEPLYDFNSFLKIVSYFKKRGLKIILITNGTLLNYNRIAQINKMIDLVYLSIHSFNPRLDYKLTSKNFLKTKLINLELLLKLEVPVILRRLVFKDNYSTIDNEISYIFNKYKGIEHFWFELGILENKGKKLRANYKYMFLNNYEILKIINSLFFKFPNVKILIDNIPKELLSEKYQQFIDPISEKFRLRVELNNVGEYVLERVKV